MLGRYYRFSGKVVYGAQRGNLLQFPTANIRVEDEDKLIPNDGVYAVWVLFKDRMLQGAMNIGTNPTFGENDRSIEVYVFDFSEDIYEETLEVQVVEKVRSEVRFPDAESLVEQVKQDVENIKNILRKTKL
jgi:riboflavin kinase/FMN adenylyltransferase